MVRRDRDPRASPDALATTFPLVVSLLNILQRMQVTELRLMSSEGHPDGDAECCFWRAGAESGEWELRVVRYL